MNRMLPFLFGLTLAFLFACGDNDGGAWLVPTDQVLDGGPGKDGIPSIDNPQFTQATDIDYLTDDDLVLGIRSASVVRAYSHPVLDWHEIVNDRIEDLAFAVTYCPLTGTGIAWDRTVDGQQTTFGVSGLLYNTNLMPYDRQTNSTWSQQRLDCVNGALIGSRINTYTMVEMSWETWKNAYPDSDVINLNTGFSRNYDRYPYGDYKTNDGRLLFPVSSTDNRLPLKERVLGVLVNDASRAYRFNAAGSGIEVFDDVLGGREMVIARSTDANFIVAFFNDAQRIFTSKADALPVIMEDADGNQWDLFGKALSGPDAGERLESTESFIGYWFSWAVFYPNIDIHSG